MARRARAITLLISATILALIVGNIALFNALPKPKRVSQQVVLDHGTSDSQFRRSMSLLLQDPVVEGNRIELLRDGPAIYDAMVEAIERAEHSITFETYEFWGEASAGRLADALVDAAERGVSVHALPDFVGSVKADKAKFDRMSDAGVEVIRWRKPSWYQLSRFNHRTHRKLLIIDGRIGFIGGANIANDWLPDNGDDAYRDNHFRVRGPVVGAMQAAFMENWLDASGKFLTDYRYFPELEFQGDYAAQLVNSAPREGRHRVRMMLLYAIAAAEESITASTAYFYPDADFIDALQEAAERGVNVRILVPGDSIGKGYLRQASINQWEPILLAGVEIHEYQPSMYHSKLITIDDAWASIGSANLDNRSFRINDEANINVYDADFARIIRELIEEDMAEAKQYSLADWRDRPWYKRLYGQIGKLVGPHL